MFRQADTVRGAWSHAARSIAGLVLAAGIASSAAAQSYRTISVDDDEKTVLIKMEDGEIVHLTVNGREVDPDSIVHADGGIWAMSGDSKVDLAEILSDLPEVPSAPPAVPALQARPVIGVSVGEPSRTLRLQLGLKEGDGIVITDVNEGMPAEKAGLVEGDIIVGIDGERGLDLEQLRKQFNDRGIGGVVELQVIRRGKLRDFDVTLAPSAPMATPTPPRFPGVIVQGDRGGRDFQVIEPGAIEYIMGDEERRAFVLRNQEYSKALEKAEEIRRLETLRRRDIERRFPGQEAERELRFFTLPDAKVLHEGLEEALVELEVRLEEQSDELEIVIEELEVRLDEALEEAESQLQGGADAFEDKFSWAEDRFFDTDERFEEIEERWEEIEMRFDEFEARFDEQELMMTRALQAIERQMGRIAERLDRE
ncbi:MAG: PDZ domain-containing protein [Planctomycetota bacterium]